MALGQLDLVQLRPMGCRSSDGRFWFGVGRMYRKEIAANTNFLGFAVGKGASWLGP